MKRTTQKDLGHALALFARAFGFPLAKTGQPGLALDYYGGGWKVVHVGGNGGESDPFGCSRRPAAELLHILYFAVGIPGAQRLHANVTHAEPITP